jgi:hypothetical protein
MLRRPIPEDYLAYTGETIVFVYVVDGHRVPFVLAVRSFALCKRNSLD